MRPGFILAWTLSIVLSFHSTQGDEIEQPLQRFTLHGDDRCSGSGETFTQNVRNLAKASYLVQTKTLRCACADFGVWSYSSRINYYYGDAGGSNLAVTKTESDKTCVTLGKNATIMSIRKVGSANVSVPAMSFYIDFSLRGRELYFDGQILQLPWPILFRSVGFTGTNASWALYATTDSSGPSTCMGQKENTLITYSSGSKMNTIGSITRDGCSYPSGETTKSSPKPGASIALNLRDRSKLLVTDANELRLPYPITVYSFTYNGNANWTLYRGIAFNGCSKCLINAGEIGIQNFVDDVEGYPLASIVVGSIRKGCHVPNTISNDEDYATQDDDIYDYEDGYGKIASNTSTSPRLLGLSMGLILLTPAFLVIHSF